MPGPLAPILLGGGFIAALLLLNKREKDAKIVPGTPGNFLAPNAPPVSVSQFSAPLQAVLNAPGPPPKQADLNTLAQIVANAQDPSTVMKAMNGQLFDTFDGFTPGGMTGTTLQAGQLPVGASVNVSSKGLANPPAAIAGTATFFKVIATSGRTFTGVSLDPRVPNQTPVSGIPFDSIIAVT